MLTLQRRFTLKNASLRRSLLLVVSTRAMGTNGATANANALSPPPLGRVVVVTSGKGGVGKTTSAASIGYGLAQRGHKTCLIDFDIGLRNLDLHLV